MKILSGGVWAHSTAFLATAAILHAHPGHDGHELTWEFSHLAQHPWATMGCAALVGATVSAVWRVIHATARPSVQGLRGSQVSRGK